MTITNSRRRRRRRRRRYFPHLLKKNKINGPIPIYEGTD